MCAATPASLPLSEAKTILGNYAWLDADSRVVFEALCGLSNNLTPAQLREQLPAQATRLGFPDVTWENYFKSANGDAGELVDLLERLLAAE
jgi:hypothetical protein